jgi:hypothetical protein
MTRENRLNISVLECHTLLLMRSMHPADSRVSTYRHAFVPEKSKARKGEWVQLQSTQVIHDLTNLETENQNDHEGDEIDGLSSSYS